MWFWTVVSVSGQVYCKATRWMLSQKRALPAFTSVLCVCVWHSSLCSMDPTDVIIDGDPSHSTPHRRNICTSQTPAPFVSSPLSSTKKLPLCSNQCRSNSLCVDTASAKPVGRVSCNNIGRRFIVLFVAKLWRPGVRRGHELDVHNGGKHCKA